jgi:hypothetical protein
MELSHDKDLLAIIAMLNTFGKNSSLVCAYTELFGLRPLKSKTKKWRLLLEEMKRLFDSETFNYQKRTYSITQPGIVEALGIVVHRNFADGLDSHNYLRKIMITISEREGKDQSKADEKDLRGREQKSMAGYDRPAGDEDDTRHPAIKPKVIQRRLSAEEVAANKERVAGILKGIGG